MFASPSVASRASPSHRKRRTSPRKDPRSGRDSNDVRRSQPDADVMSTLLESFDALTQDAARRESDDRPGAPSPRAPRTPSVASQRIKAIDPSADFPQFKHPYIEPEDQTPDVDAAEPPVIRTSRPPSGYSKLTAKKLSRLKTPTQSPRVSRPTTPTSSVSRIRDVLTPLRSSPFEQRRGPSSVRSSVDVDRDSSRNTSRRGSFTLNLTGESSKGKERASAKSPARAGSAQSFSAQITEGPTTPERNSSLQATHKLNSRDTSRTNGSGTSRSPRSERVRGESSKGRIYVMDPDGDDVPVVLDSSEARSHQNPSGVGPNPQPLARSSIGISRPGSQSAPRGGVSGIANEPGSSTNAAGEKIVPHIDEESDVSRRIAELKAAKEQRRSLAMFNGSNDLSNSPLKPNDMPPSPSEVSPPVTSRANEQLARALSVEHRQITQNNAGQGTPREDGLQNHKSGLEENTTTRFLLADSAQSLERSAKTSMDYSAAHSPAMSRTSSRAKRYSVGNTSLRPENRKRDTLGTVSSHPRLPEEGRVSVDSVEASVSEFLEAPRLSQRTFPPNEKRKIAFSEVGDPHGFPVFCCVGMGLTRYVIAFYDELAASLKLRLITPERPGIGDSEPRADGSRTPLSWPDDVQAICNHLDIQEFSLLAHSAGAIYALATALRMPQNIRCKIHLLSPWIPPSQMSPIGLPASNVPVGTLPRAQRFLRILPTPFLKLTNASFLGSGSLSRKDVAKSMAAKPRKSADVQNSTINASSRPSTANRAMSPPSPFPGGKPSYIDGIMASDQNMAATVLYAGAAAPKLPSSFLHSAAAEALSEAKDRQRRYDQELTSRIWDLARQNANPAVDLLVCFERNQPIGFRYLDIHRSVVIHHGSKDNRVPVDNVQWLARTMFNAEVRVLEGEGHSLMANAGVMGNVLTEMSKEWEEGPDAWELTAPIKVTAGRKSR